MLNFKIVLALSLFLTTGNIYGQSQDDNLNLVIIVNEELRPGSLMNMYLSDKNDQTKVPVMYVPGELKVQSAKTLKGDSLYLNIDYYIATQNDSNSRRFKIPFPRKYFEWDYLVIRLYDLKCRKYKKMFDPYKEGADFTFEIDYPGGQVMRVRKRKSW